MSANSIIIRHYTSCWKKCSQFWVPPGTSRQIWTSKVHLKRPVEPAVKTIKNSSGRFVSTREKLLQFSKIIGVFDRRHKLDVGHSFLRGLSTSNVSLLDQSLEKENRNFNAGTMYDNQEGTCTPGTSSREDVANEASSEDLQEADEYLSPEQWKVLKEEWNRNAKPFQPQTLFESRTMARLCGRFFFQKGRSLIEYIRQEGSPLTYPLMSSYLYLCIREGNHEEFFSVKEWFAANHPVLDDGVLSNLIAGFCQTSRWQESLKMLEDLKQLGQPTARNYQNIICAACDSGDFNLVEELLQDLYSQGTCPTEQTCLKLLQTFHCDTKDPSVSVRSNKLVTDLLKYFRSKRFYPSVTVGNELKNWFPRNHGDVHVWKAFMTRVTKNGKCKSCGSQLESVDLGQEDFLNLQHQITDKVIKGGDIFKKTRPDEFQAFMEFVDEGAPYDVIIDGLNVAHIRPNVLPSKLLRQFVVYLAQECRLKCLVLGRQHMLDYNKAWSRHHMEVIQDVADCFFTENVSEDDPFMLYATLHSGPKACYVSRDMLRDHKALLDQPTHVAFVKWQRGHQMYPLAFEGGRAKFKARTAHDTVAQYTDSGWHVPCDDGLPRFSYQVPLDWLCARKVKVSPSSISGQA